MTRPATRITRPLHLAALAAFAVFLCVRPARAIDYNFAGSVSLNYKTLVNELSDPKAQRNLMLSGFNVNASIKAVVDVTRYLSATTKVCYGCHGFEALNFYADLTPHPAFNVRAGRIMPSFGDFYLRHDPTAHKTVDNPLPYDMGHMVRGREWNYGVLPVPNVDNGAEIYGTLRPTDWFSIAYAASVTSGWKSPDGSTTSVCQPPNSGQTGFCAPTHDFGLRRMRFVTSSDYLVDNNRWPQFGGRLALTFARSGNMSAAVPDITLGGSVLYGFYDDYDRLSYLIYGADLYIHLWRINLRGEVLRRQQDVDVRLLDLPDGTSTGLKNMSEIIEQTTKDGFYAEADFPMGNYLEGVLRVDGMRRGGPRDARANPDDKDLPASMRSAYRAPASAVLDFDDWIMRYTVGLNVIPVTGAKLKLSYEYWTFKDVPGDQMRQDAKFQDEYMIHVALVAGF